MKGRLFRRIGLSTVLLALGFPTVNGSTAFGQAGDTAAIVGPHVAHITGPGRIGSGIVVYPGNIIITAAHVVGNSSQVSVAIPGYRRYNARVLKRESDDDVAILDVPPGPVPIGLRFSEIPPTVGDEVWLFGYPVTSFRVVATRGIVSAIYGYYFQIDAAAAPGSSGGPATTRGGRVLGMLTFGLRGHQGFNFLVGSLRLAEIAAPFLGSAPQTLVPTQPSPPPAAEPPPPVPPSTPSSPPTPTTPTPVFPTSMPDGSSSWSVGPGAGAGPVAIGSSRGAVEARVGLPDENRASESWIIGVYRRYGLAIFYSSSNIIEVVAISAGSVSGITMSVPIAVLRPLYVTTSGVRLGDTRDGVVRAHGFPNSTSVNVNNVEFLNYRGISFGIDQGLVVHMLISRM